MCQTIYGAPNRVLHLAAHLRLPPALDAVMVIFNVCPPSGVFSTTTFLHEILVFSSVSRGSSMMITLPLPLLAALGRTRTFLSSKLVMDALEGHFEFLPADGAFGIEGRVDVLVDTLDLGFVRFGGGGEVGAVVRGHDMCIRDSHAQSL